MPFLSPSLQRQLKLAALVLASLGLVALSVHVMLLDREVRTRFAGARWALPAQVYAAPLEIYPGLDLTRAAFRRELERLGYRVGKAADRPGQFATSKTRVDVHTRPVMFWDGPQPAVQVQVKFDERRIVEIYEPARRTGRRLLRLDPLLIGSIYPTQGEDRALVRLDEVPPLLPDGLIHIEDRHFRGHFGLDPVGILRAAWANLRAGRTVQGGSTITQQLVKNFFLSNERSWKRKINEAIMAMLLELHYEKDEILEAYLNEVHLGQDGARAVHGFGLAAQFYFNKPASELQTQEIALLIALVKGPSYYNPRRNPERALERRNLVLSILADAGLVPAEELPALHNSPLGVVGGTSAADVARYPAFVDLVKRQLQGQYPEEALTHEGLRIFTTLDPRAQAVLEKRLVEGLPHLEKGYHIKAGTLEGAGVITTVDGGEVLALVGARDVRYSGFNRALDARRPIGSLAKPFVYLAALMQPDRYSLVTPIEDEPIDVPLDHGPIWSPQNYDKTVHGTVPLFEALAQSYNLAAVRLGLDVGLANVRQIFRASGMLDDPPALPSLFLGAVDLAPLEVAQMYGTLAAAGYQSPVLAIREVLTREGTPLSRYPLRVRQALPEAPVYLLNWALEQVMVRGTGTPAYGYVAPTVRLAGKTGTTDDLRDSWFAGYGEDRVVVIWVGRDDNLPANLTGAQGALTIWAPVVRDLGVKSLDITLPPNVQVARDCQSGIDIPYIEDHEPPECSGWKSLFRW